MAKKQAAKKAARKPARARRVTRAELDRAAQTPAPNAAEVDRTRANTRN